MTITLIATAKFGLERIVKNEIQALGFDSTQVSDGKIEFEAALDDIPKANLWLRCADRVFLKMGQFKALTFDDLFEQTKALPWENLITKDGQFNVNGKSVKSTLRSVRASQSIVKKAVVERLKEKYAVSQLPETGAAFTIQVSILHDTATLSLDTSGNGLHKRGYRAQAGEAPLKETFAAGLVRLSSWRAGELLIDPMCGSGTILIEAALIARNMAPGLNRTFAAEGWPSIPAAAWRESREAARAAIRSRAAIHAGAEHRLFGYDIDPAVIVIAKENAQKAGVADDIMFEQKDVNDLWIDRQHGTVISNPPYGQRMGGFHKLNAIYITLNKMFKKKKGWAIFILTADDKFPDYFKRARPDRVRKLYNGRIPTNYYQYHGEQP